MRHLRLSLPACVSLLAHPVLVMLLLMLRASLRLPRRRQRQGVRAVARVAQLLLQCCGWLLQTRLDQAQVQLTLRRAQQPPSHRQSLQRLQRHVMALLLSSARNFWP